jgi:chemotaxis signal transduction protein
MNNDAITSVRSHASLTQEALEQNLIAALTRLQNTAFEKELLGSRVSVAADAKPETFFGFSIGTYHFMVAASCFCEVLVDTAIASIPNAPSCLVGLSNVRGVLMPIYQLHSALELESPKKSIIFAVGKGDAAFGILIDNLPISLLVSASQRQAASKQENPVLQQLIASQYFSGQQHWLVLNGVELGAQLLALANQSHKPHAYLSAGRELAYS